MSDCPTYADGPKADPMLEKVYVSDIFPTRTRHYGLATASASQWLWSEWFLLSFCPTDSICFPIVDFVVSKQTPIMKTQLGYKLFIMFASVNIGAMGLFSL